MFIYGSSYTSKSVESNSEMIKRPRVYTIDIKKITAIRDVFL